MAETIGKQFMIQTSIPRLEPSEQSQGQPQPALESAPPEGEKIFLPRPEQVDLGHIDLRAAIENRRSLRQYSDDPLSLEELSFLLWCTQGVKKVSKRPATLRTVPSAGARHAFETLLLINRVDGLQAGLYRFLAIEHGLVRVESGEDIASQVTEACQHQEHVAASAATFMWIAVLERMRWRYGQRGYRYLHLDAGHVCQNLYLAAEAVNCGVCAIAAFDDDALNGVLGLDGDNQFVVYLGSLGRKSEPKQV
ncbi:SagB/ThcOx family dehydrogenase [bacterium]|nr:MAG: SagB/ThcOx family dehydrogenase [bacterium]